MYSSLSSRNKSGFTLIELVVVIVLIGILAATALPKFSNLTTQARVAANQGLAGALGSAVNIAHGGWLAAGAVAGGTTILLEGTTIYVNTNGWPTNSAAATAGANPSASECANVWNNILNNPPPAAAGTCTGNNCYVASTTATACVYTLSGNPAGGPYTVTYNFGTGQVVASP